MKRVLWGSGLIGLGIALALSAAVLLHAVALLAGTQFTAGDVIDDLRQRATRAPQRDHLASEYRADEIESSGATALAYTLARFGEKVTEGAFLGRGSRPLTAPTPDDLVLAARRLNYRLRMETGGSQTLPKVGLQPLIALMSGGLYVVLHDTRDGVALFDPRLGRVITVAPHDFLAQWSGTVLRFEPGLWVPK